MKKRSFYSTVAVVFCLMAAPALAVTNMTPVLVTGFNRDVVVENTASGPPFTAYAMEFNQGEGTAYYQKGLPGYTNGLPVDGTFTNPADGTIFQFQPYTADNVVDITNDLTGSLSLPIPTQFSRIAILANSGNGTSSGLATVTLTFSDGSTFTTNYYAPDWFNNNSTATYTMVLEGVDRIDLTAGGANSGGSGGNPRFYQTTIPLYTLGASNKPLASLTFGMPASTLTTGIYAVSGLPNSQVLPEPVTNAPATGIDAVTATLNGQVTDIGEEPPFVTLFYGTNDGGAVAADWSNSVAIGYQTSAFSQTVTSLIPGTTYYFTAQGVNAGGTVWATPSLSFSTLSGVPAVTNLPASSIQGTIATLNGEVFNADGLTSSVTLYYGSADGETNPAAWANSIDLGSQSGAFAQTISGLAPDTTYYYTAEAVNSAGAGWATPSLSFTTGATNSAGPSTAVLTQHNDDNRSGDNLTETTLNIENVNTNSFGLLYTRPVDDQIYAQPLIMTNVSILGHGSHNLLIVATVNDSIYAYDADDPTVTQPYWQDSFISPPNIVAPDSADENAIGANGGNYTDFSGNFGIVGTPVIDPANQTLYVVVRTKEISNDTTNFVQRLHALNVATGAEQPNSPVVITATYPGTGDGGSVISFDPLRENQRPGLALDNGVVYISWASHADNTPFHGWVIGYSETNLQQTAVWNVTPNGSEGGIWMSGGAPCVDTNGNLYVSVGNGTVDTTANNDYGESFLKLVPTNGTIQLASYFIPYNYASLNSADRDLGVGGLLLIPGTTLAISGSKTGVLYLVNRDNMGGLSTGIADTNVVQTWSLNSSQIHGGPVWWSCTNGSFMYIWPSSSDHLRQYQFTNGLFNTTPYAESVTTGGSGSPGGILSVSAVGTNVGTGIIWATVNTTSSANQGIVAGTLHAYDAQNVTDELWNSDMVPGRDQLGNLAKFVPPTVANGKVYAATFSGQVNVYGLLPRPSLTVNADAANTLFISWPTNAFLTYTLQSSTNLLSGNWVSATYVPVTTNGGCLVTIPITASAPPTYYRLAW